MDATLYIYGGECIDCVGLSEGHVRVRGEVSGLRGRPPSTTPFISVLNPYYLPTYIRIMKPSTSTIPSTYSSTSTTNQFYTDQHKYLHDLLTQLPLQRAGNFTASSHATLVRQLFSTIWQKDLIRHWDIERGDYPSGKELGDWVKRDEHGIEVGWSLHEAQNRVIARKGGNVRVRKGRLCGKILQRYERTYSCKWVESIEV
jgi:hypothetical protein